MADEKKDEKGQEGKDTNKTFTQSEHDQAVAAAVAKAMEPFKDFESVKTISETIGQRADTPVIASLSRAGSVDILRSAEALKPAKRKRIHIVIATSDLHMKHKLRMCSDEVVQASVASVTLARQHADDVE